MPQEEIEMLEGAAVLPVRKVRYAASFPSTTYAQVINKRYTEVECVYIDRRSKGGIKTGAIDQLNQRIG